MQIVWSEEALSDYHQIIDYLLLEWSEKSARTFIDEVDSVLFLLQRQPELFPLSAVPAVRRAVIRKQVTLYYTIRQEELVLVRIWNTKQNPTRLTFG